MYVNVAMFAAELMRVLAGLVGRPPPLPRNHSSDSAWASSEPSGRPKPMLPVFCWTSSASAFSWSQVVGGVVMPAWVNSFLL